MTVVDSTIGRVIERVERVHVQKFSDPQSRRVTYFPPAHSSKMSFLGRSGSMNSNGGVNPEKIEMAITEFVALLCRSSVLSYNLFQIGYCNGLFQPDGLVSDAFTTPLSNAKQTSRSCYSKCISQRFTEGDLNKGENVCIDRCVSKYNDVQKKIGEKLQARGAANASGSSTFSAL